MDLPIFSLIIYLGEDYLNNRLNNLDLSDILFIIKKHLVTIIICTVVCGTIGFLSSKFIIPPQYEAEAELVVNTTQKSTDAAQIYDAVELSQKEVDTYAIIMENNTILNKVKRDLHLDVTKKELTKRIKIEGIGTTEVLDIKVTDRSPAMALAITKEIIKYAPSEIIRTVKAGSVEVVSVPETSNQPVSPNIPLNTGVAFTIGLILSALASFLIELFNNTFASDDDIAKYLGYTVIGIVPIVETRKRKGTV